MKSLTTKEIQQEETNILKELILILDKNKIEYTVGGGTMLGTIRHKGFIPWDDDIDILIPRPDYERLICILKKNNLKVGNYIANSVLLNNGYYPFIKIVNQNINTYNEKIINSKQLNLWIDVFPIDGLPEDEISRKKLFKKIARYKSIYMTKVFKINYLLESTKKIKILPRLILKILLLPVPINFISKKMDNVSKKIDYNSSSYAGNLLWGYGQKETMFKKDISYTNFQFEDLKVKGLKNYDSYLNNLYGDYMKLPPKEERKTHSFKAWRNN